MVSVALCDDDEAQLAHIASLLDAYGAQHPEIRLRVCRFASGERLLDSAQQEGFDLYLLDVLMPGLSGIDVGLRLREMGDEGEIIYLSASQEHAVESYQAQAFFYLLKPVESDRLFAVLERALGRLAQTRSQCVVVHTSTGAERISLQEIIYVERVQRSMGYHCTGGRTVFSVSLRTSFREAATPLLASRCFLLCGASFAVNLRHVAAVEQTAAVMDDATRVPIPRRLGPQIKRAWMDYWLEADKKW